jgi:hypothetical protein
MMTACDAEHVLDWITPFKKRVRPAYKIMGVDMHG